MLIMVAGIGATGSHDTNIATVDVMSVSRSQSLELSFFNLTQLLLQFFVDNGVHRVSESVRHFPHLFDLSHLFPLSDDRLFVCQP